MFYIFQPHKVSISHLQHIIHTFINNSSYLGVLFSKSGNFSMAKKAQVEKATTAMFEVLKRGKIHSLSIQCQ
jgi:hypothetical protein